MKKIFEISIIICLLILNSCCRDRDPNKKGCQTEKPVQKTGPYPLGINKDYLYFKTGSWWVYKNNLSNETDSIVTLKCDTSSSHIEEDLPSAIYETTFTAISIRQKSMTFNYDIFYECNGIAAHDYHFFLNKSSSFATTTAYSIPYAYPYLPETYFVELIPSLIIQGKTYTDVAVFQTGFDETLQYPLNLPYTIYFQSTVKYNWAKGFGLVKIEAQTFRNDNNLPITLVWELINYNLIK